MRYVALLLISFMLSGCAETPSELPVEQTPVATATIEVSVPGIHCESCAANVSKTLTGHPGVVEVDVNVDSKTVSLAINEESFQLDAAIEALAEAKFKDAALVATPLEPASPLEVVEQPSEEPAAEDATSAEG